MAPVTKQPDDFVIQNRSNADAAGTWIEAYVLVGPGLSPSGLQFRSKDTAEASGKDLASKALASLWYEHESHKDHGELVATYRGT